MSIERLPDDEIERAAVLRLALRHVEFVKMALSDPDRAERWLRDFGMSEEAAGELLYARAAREVKKRRGPRADFAETINRPARLRAYETVLKTMRVAHRFAPKGVTGIAALRRALGPWRAASVSDETLAHVAEYRRQRATGENRRTLALAPDALSFEKRAAMVVYGCEEGPPPPDEVERAMRHLRNDQKADRKPHP